MTTTTAQLRTRVLGHYTTTAGERTIYARCKQGVTYVTDEPASRNSPGVLYAVEQLPAEDGEAALDALVADYLKTAQVSGRVPMEKTLFGVDLQAAA